MTALSAQILEAAGRRPEGSLLAAKEFLALGKRDAVDQALRRLVNRGQLVKITRGRYALPVRSRFGTRPPAPELVMARLQEEQSEQLLSSGVAAANALGLTSSCWPIALPARRSAPWPGWAPIRPAPLY